MLDWFTKLRPNAKNESPLSSTAEFQQIIDQVNDIFNNGIYSQRPELIKSVLQGIKKRGTEFTINLALQCVHQVYALDLKTHTRQVYTCQELLKLLFRSSFATTENQFRALLEAFEQSLPAGSQIFYTYPIMPLLQQLEKYAKANSLSADFTQYLHSVANSTLLTVLPNSYYSKESDKAKTILARLINKTASGEYLVVMANEHDRFGTTINLITAQSSPSQRNILYGLLAHYKKASGGKPSGKYIQEVQRLYKQLGDSGVYISIVKQWLAGFKQTEVQSQSFTNYYSGREYIHSTYTFLHEVNAIIAKGIVWSLVGLVEQDAELLKLLSDVSEKSYQKIPGQGPAAAGVGNACLYVLAQSDMAGMGQLSRLKIRIKQANTQALIEKYIQEASIKLGVSPQAIEDMAVTDYGLVNGTLTQSFGDYRASVTIVGVGKVEWQWSKADGTVLKSEPAAVKKEFSADLKTLKITVADIAKNTTAQRDRLDRSLLLDRRWTWQEFTDHYAGHGLMSFLAQRLIWTVEKKEQTADIFYQNEVWADINGVSISWIDSNTTVRLWHPVNKSVDAVITWREFLSQHAIRQPLKQAFREVYLLTDAELNTRLYSNRMAAHILKQHQFNTLAKGRGWRYSLLGAYDKGYESEKARIDMPVYDLKAEFWVSEVNADDAWNDTGIYLYVSTDQVRFTRMNDSDPLTLMDIPPLVFSEIMRDVDLFVGVASVGNDPNWRDGGLTQFRTYWESYSFGELGELAKSRKQAVERLLPRLKIAQTAEVRDKFLVVHGKLRTYKIHLGSGNILMEPNDQYLCIVPDRRSDNVPNNVFLPFEGDAVLSIILSKAFLLTDDDKITDETIIRQIR